MYVLLYFVLNRWPWQRISVTDKSFLWAGWTKCMVLYYNYCVVPTMKLSVGHICESSRAASQLYQLDIVTAIIIAHTSYHVLNKIKWLILLLKAEQIFYTITADEVNFAFDIYFSTLYWVWNSEMCPFSHNPLDGVAAAGESLLCCSRRRAL